MNCPVCGHAEPENALRCASCGAELSAPTDDPAHAATKITGAYAPSRKPASDTDPSMISSFSGSGWTPAVLVVGTSLGTRYEIQALLGRGGMGAVYKAFDRELGRTVAIKVINPDMAARPSVLERFKREIVLASKVTHRNVLRVHDLGEAGDVKFISMAYVEGTSLNVLLQQEGPMSIERALPILRQLCDALQAAHDAGVVHRDLKPQNVLIDKDGNAFIADFGISRSIDTGGTITELGMVMGTVHYMSPEQARGERSDHRGDIYSLGVMLFQIFTGTLPFTGGDAVSVLMKRAQQEPPSMRRVSPEVPAWLSEVVSRAVRLDPESRYQSVTELMRDLERRQASTSWRWVRRKVLVPAVGLLAISAAVVAGVRYWRARPSVAPAPVTSLVVLPFRNDTGDSRYEWARDGLPSLLRDDLLEARELRLVGDDRMRDILGALRTPDGEEQRPATMRQLASLIGADHVLAGRLLKIGDRLRIEARLQRAGSEGSSAPPLMVDGSGDESIQTMVNQLAPQVLEAVGVSRGWLQHARSATVPLTSSAEALALYGEALPLIRAGRQLDASKRLEAAVEKDPAFSVARAMLAETYDRLGYSDKASAEAKTAAAGLGSASPVAAARIRATLALMEGDFEAAEKAYASLCEITPSDADALFSLATVREKRGNLPGALEAFRRVVALDAKNPSARFALGRLLSKLGNPTEAAEQLNEALRLHEETGNDEGKATILNGLGNVYLRTGNIEEALARFQGALAIRRKIGDQKGVWVSLDNVATVFARLGRFDDAIKEGEEAVAVARQIGDKPGLAKTNSLLGEIYFGAGQSDRGMAAYEQSLKYFRERGVSEPAAEVRTLANIADARTVLGRYVEALYSLKDALAKRREIGDKGEIMRSLLDIGINERLQGGYEEALKYDTEGLSLAREVADKTYTIGFLLSLSNIHEDQGNYGAALSLLAEADSLARESKDDAQLASSLAYEGSVRRRLGDLAGAAVALDEALPLARKTNNPTLVAEISSVQAAMRVAQGERDRAAAESKEALRVANTCKDPWLLLMVRLQAGEAARSVHDLELVGKEADSAGLVPIVGDAHLALARVKLAAGQHRDAVREADLAMTTATSLGQRDVLFQAQHLSGEALVKQGDRSRAADRFSAALTPLDEMRRGLKDEPLKSFLARGETAEFAKSAGDFFLATNRTGDAERLQALLRP
jgi:tetratricopeptide (TPR) repeat protein/TolB-like protein